MPVPSVILTNYRQDKLLSLGFWFDGACRLYVTLIFAGNMPMSKSHPYSASYNSRTVSGLAFHNYHPHGGVMRRQVCYDPYDTI